MLAQARERGAQRLPPPAMPGRELRVQSRRCGARAVGVRAGEESCGSEHARKLVVAQGMEKQAGPTAAGGSHSDASDENKKERMGVSAITCAAQAGGPRSGGGVGGRRLVLREVPPHPPFRARDLLFAPPTDVFRDQPVCTRAIPFPDVLISEILGSMSALVDAARSVFDAAARSPLVRAHCHPRVHGCRLVPGRTCKPHVSVERSRRVGGSNRAQMRGEARERSRRGGEVKSTAQGCRC
jgi:hypothetical protein